MLNITTHQHNALYCMPTSLDNVLKEQWQYFIYATFMTILRSHL